MLDCLYQAQKPVPNPYLKLLNFIDVPMRRDQDFSDKSVWLTYQLWRCDGPRCPDLYDT